MGQGKSRYQDGDEDWNEHNEYPEQGTSYTQQQPSTLNADLINTKRDRQRVNEDRKLRRKWRRKQGYSLPVGFDTPQQQSVGESASQLGNSFRNNRKSSNHILKEKETSNLRKKEEGKSRRKAF